METTFAKQIKAYREQHNLTQTQLAELSGVRREYISSMELGRTGVVYPEQFNKVKAVLGFPGWVMLEAMGFETDAQPQTVGLGTRGAVSQPLLAALAEMDTAQQKAMFDIVMAVRRLQDATLSGNQTRD